MKLKINKTILQYLIIYTLYSTIKIIFRFNKTWYFLVNSNEYKYFTLKLILIILPRTHLTLFSESRELEGNKDECNN